MGKRDEKRAFKNLKNKNNVEEKKGGKKRTRKKNFEIIEKKNELKISKIEKNGKMSTTKNKK